ncbi:hypothetical protein PV11_07898 [Exophiala sideris]|uniref:Zn(2)-C6 fungal-type domain-containing protein n=1 Tax=Exophiala sideris TaxID=1016849 RepID=A0A0D1YBL4_9EURO|nr:hypothetical protein PV11_07898 [Exophiala sideris]
MNKSHFRGLRGLFLDGNHPTPHPKMRKGTRSCYECRRRKTKCIFAEENPLKCRECYARGAPCVDQGTVPVSLSCPLYPSSKHSGAEGNPQSYSLRERVARLEDFIETYLLEEDNLVTADARSALREHRTSRPGEQPLGTPMSPEQDLPQKDNVDAAVPAGANPSRQTTPSTDQSPVLSLFNNHVITQVEVSAKPSEKRLTTLFPPLSK